MPVLPYIVAMFIAWIFSMVISAILNPRREAEQVLLKRQGQRVNARSNEDPVPVVYGTIRVGGNLVYITTSGENDKYLHLILAMAEGECEGIVQLDEVDQIFFDDQIYTDFGDTVVYEFFNGSPHQTLTGTTLKEHLPDFTDNMRNTCFLYLRLEFDPDIYQAVPNINVVLQGRKVFDTRDKTWKFTNNPAMVVRDFIVNKRFGKGEDQSVIDSVSFNAVANTLDEKEWTIDAVLYKNDSASDVLEALLTNFRGGLVYSSSGIYKLIYMDTNYESNSLDLDEDDIIEDTLSVSEKGAYDVHNTFRFSFLDEDIGHKVNEFTILAAGYDPTSKEENAINIDLNGITNYAKAYKLASYYVDREVLSQQVDFVAKERCLALEPFDLITLTHSFLGWEEKSLRVVSVRAQENHTVAITCIYEEESLYDDQVNVDTHSYSSTKLIDPKAPVPSVYGVTDSETVYDFRLRSFTRWNISFSPPANYPWFSHVEVWYSDDAFETSRFLFSASEDFAVDPIEEQKLHYLKLRVVNIFGVKESLDNCYVLSRFIEGKTSAPASLESLLVTCQDDSVYLYAPKVSDPDIEIYEFRLGTSWSTAVFLVANRNPSFSLKGVKPGEHTFWCNTLSNNGVYGETPRSATVVTTIDPPKGWAANSGGDWAGGDPVNDFDEGVDGTHNNTQKYDTGGGDYRLRCGHMAGVLTGVYTSKVYDSGANDTYLAYLRTTIGVMGVGTTWDSKIAIVTTGSQLVANGDFESGLTGWSSSNATNEIETADPYAGVNSLKVTINVLGGVTYKDIAVTPEKWYKLSFYYKQTVGLGQFYVYDLINGEYITPGAPVNLESAASWTNYDYLFYAPAGCTSIRIGLGGQSANSVIFWDNVYIYEVDEANSPTWDDINAESVSWNNLFASTQAIRVQIKLRWGDAVDDLPYEAEMMEILTTVATGRYFQFEITIIDPDNNIYALVDDVEFALCT